MAHPETDQQILAELAPRAEELVHRHYSTTREWFPHEMIPWEQAEDFRKVPWAPEQSQLDKVTQEALIVNVLTEDNLPGYYETISRMVGRHEVWGEWTRRWSAEEARHFTVIRDYLMVTRAVDPVALERARISQMSGGFDGGYLPSPLDVFAYVALQELATRLSHWNTGNRLPDADGRKIMERVAKDENLHHLLYRDLVTAALEVAPSLTMEAICRQVVDFQMPGTGIPNFGEMARDIAKGGIYDLQLHHDKILAPIINQHWKLEQVTGLSDPAEQARETIIKHMQRVKRVGDKLAQARDAQLAAAGA